MAYGANLTQAAGLAARDRRCAELRAYGLTIAAIAQRLGISATAVWDGLRREAQRRHAEAGLETRE